MKLGKKVIQSLKFLAFLAIGVLLLWLAMRKMNFRNFMDELKAADYLWIFVSLAFGLLAYLSRARRWVILIHPLGHKPTFRHTFYALMSGYLANLALPRLGEITRCVALGEKEKIPVDKLIGTVIVERTIDLVCLLIIMAALLLTSGSLIKKFLLDSILVPLQQKAEDIFGNAIIFWIILGALFITAITLVIKYKHELRKIRYFSKLFDLARGVIEGLKTIANLKHSWEFIFHTVFIWINYALMTWVVVFALESTSHITFWNSIFILVIGGLAMSAPVPGGIGAFHYFVSRGLAAVQGIPLEDGMVYAVLTHESQMLFVIIIGALSFFAMFGLHHHRQEAKAD